MRVEKRQSYHVGDLAATLLQVARQALEEVGPNKLSLRDVASRSGVSSAAVYHHYANRSALIAQLAIVGFQELGAKVRQANINSKGGDPLEAAMLAYVDFGRANPSLYQLMFGPEIAACEGLPELKRASHDSYDAFKQVVADHLRQSMEATAVAQAGLAGWSLGHGLVLLLINGVLALPTQLSTKKLVANALTGHSLLLRNR